MSISRYAAAAAAILALTATTVPVAYAHDRAMSQSHPRQSAQTIVGVAAGNDDFSTLVAAVQAADLAGTLSSSGPFTVFAPTNAAFEDLPHGTVDRLLQPRRKAQLTSILTYHVVAGRFTAADLATAVRVGGGSAELTTVEGGRLTVSSRGRNGLRLTDAAGNHIDIIAADVRASNGIIHAIDGVLMPE